MAMLSRSTKDSIGELRFEANAPKDQQARVDDLLGTINFVIHIRPGLVL